MRLTAQWILDESVPIKDIGNRLKCRNTSILSLSLEELGSLHFAKSIGSSAGQFSEELVQRQRDTVLRLRSSVQRSKSCGDVRRLGLLA